MRTDSLHTVWQTLMLYPTSWASPGRPKKTSLSARSPPSSAYPGTLPTTRSACQRARKQNTSRPSCNGSPSQNTCWTMCKDYMENYCMPATFYPLDEHTSPTWRPSWEFATMTVLSAGVHHSAELRSTFSGGRRSSPSLPSSGTSQDPSPLLTPTLTQTLALKLVLGSRSATDGGPGSFYQGGKPTAETLNKPTNDIFKHIHALSEVQGVLFHMRYVPSKENPADGPSRGEYYHSSLLLPAITIPMSLRQYIHDFDVPCSPAESLLIQQGEAPIPLPRADCLSLQQERTAINTALEEYARTIFAQTQYWLDG